MSNWPQHPLVYEINTWVWLHELSLAHNRPVTLANVPAAAWDELAALHVDAIWLMGVWERSPAGIVVALENRGLMADFERALPDFTRVDVIGSPFSVRRYRVDERLGGPEGLAIARGELKRRGLRLVLDFVPNHVAPDHHWLREHPEYFIGGDAADLAREPEAFFAAGEQVIARGRDPYFPPWPDVAQLNAFHPGMRAALMATLREIAAQCDGMRCDMAMLMMTDIFARTWGTRAGARPAEEFWPQTIAAVRRDFPEVLFIAEVYWDLEWDLLQQGFDYCYDKRLYDWLAAERTEAATYTFDDVARQSRMVHFIENHDEQRAASMFGEARSRAAAALAMTLPGMRLLHEGQFDGWRVRLPVFLGRRVVEASHAELRLFYQRLTPLAASIAGRDGQWRLCECTGWPDNATYRQILAWCWSGSAGRCVIVVNYSAAPAQARVRIPWDNLAGKVWRLDDRLSGAIYERDGDEMRDPGLFVDLPSWGMHILVL